MKNKGLRAIGKALIVVLALITIAFGFQVTKVNLAETKSPTRQTQLTRILRALAKPDIFTRDTTDLIVELPVVIPCGAEQPAPADTSKPYLVMEPACAEPRATVTVKGYNLPPNAKGPLAFVPPSNVTLGLANIETDANGYFEAQVKLPNRPDTTVQTIRLTTRTPSGAPKFSRSAIETWDKIVETIFLALLATIIGTLFAVPVSFLAARNLMEKVNSPLISVALNLILIPLGAFLGIRLAALLKGLLTLPAANWVIALPGLIVVLAAAFFILTKGMPAVDKEKADTATVARTTALMLLVGILSVIALILIAGLLMTIGKAITPVLGGFGFIGKFLATSGEIVEMLVPVVGAIIVIGLLSSIGSRIGRFITQKVSEGTARIISSVLSLLAGAILFVLVMQMLNWFYQFRNPHIALTYPAILGGLVGLFLSLRLKPKDNLPVGMVIYFVVRTIANALRSIEALVWVIVFVVWVGIGPFAGVLALSLHTIAALAKLYSEQVESSLPSPREAI